MAKFVIAGKAGCSSYARAEMLGDALVAQLPNFKLTKVKWDVFAVLTGHVIVVTGGEIGGSMVYLAGK